MTVHGLHEEVTRRHQASLRNALGPIVGDALGRRTEVTDILINDDGRLWVDTLTEGMTDTGEVISAEQTGAMLAFIAGLMDKLVDARNPILEGEIPFNGNRIEGVVPPISHRPILAIRKRAEKVFPLSDYLHPSEGTDATASRTAAAPPERGYEATLRWAARERKNILIAGGTNSAKTSLLNSLLGLLLEESGPSERFFLIEDTFELQCPAPNKINLQTSEDVSLARLVRVAMRMRPDRIIIGEVRGAEALPMLRAWNTGHDGGICTVHANSAAEGLDRLEELVQEAGVPPQSRLIARTIDVVCFLRRVGHRARVIAEMLRVTGHDGRDYTTGPVEP